MKKRKNKKIRKVGVLVIVIFLLSIYGLIRLVYDILTKLNLI